MKITFSIGVVILVVTLLCHPAQSQKISEGATAISSFKYADLNWTVPEVGKEVQREEMPNGIILYFMEDHRLPLVNVSAMLRCGEAYAATDQMAIPGLTGTVMRSGGTTNIAADSMNTLLESLGAVLESSIGFENGSATLNVISKDLETGIKLLADLLRNPAFPQDKLDIAKEEIRTSIKRRNDSPANIISREFSNMLYGNHPLGRILEWSMVKNVSRDDLTAYHSQYFAPNNLMLGITGDYDRNALKKLLTKYFGDWQKKEIALPKVPEVAAAPKPGVYELAKDLNQTNILFGHLGIKRDNPDRFAISVMNYILGGGSFTSRMTSRVRSDEGLAYSVNSRFQTSSRELGTFTASTQTKAATTHKALQLMLDEVKKIREGAVSDEELTSAKDSYLNSYIFNFTRAEQIVNQLMELEFYDLPRDQLQKYFDNIRAVTKEDVLRVAKTYLKPENLTFFVLGNSANFDKPLDSFGPVTKLEIKPSVID